jgi:trimethylamine--corrinoid protein Co-methyltransferase
MDANYSALQTPQFRVLSDRQIERVYYATLECLQRTGVQVHNGPARDVLAQAGARVDGIRVRFPPHLIQGAIASTPRTFTLWGRDGRPQIQVAPDRVAFGPGPTCTHFVDPITGERRPTRQGDPAATALVCDALPNIDYVMSLGLISDVTPQLAPVYEFAEMVAQTTKPILPWAYSAQNVADIYQIAAAAAGGEGALRSRPFFALFTTYQSPLVQTAEDLDNAFWAVERDIPVILMGGGTAGETAPITGAGALVVALGGALAGLTAIQLHRPGAPVCIGAVALGMDLATSRPAYGAPEMSLYAAAMADVCRYLGLPAMGTAGASEAKTLDLQAAIESSVQIVFSALSGTPLVHDIGFLDCADIGSLEMLVMNDEIISLARRVLRGLEVSDDTLMLDLIDQVGPGGEYLSAKSTAKRCRAEIWQPRLLDRSAWVLWELGGSLTMQDRIRQRLAEILATHRALPLSATATEEIAAILEAAELRHGQPPSRRRAAAAA